ncbi:B3GT5 galactosyltransferase, partial [Psilopogon haemacephalus]|nr:B3GT5 galactosyltransferase [Psilopogon haemacephalus]
PLRSSAYKWFVPPEVYPQPTYPPYCGGAAYVLSADLAPQVWGVAQQLPLINMEDAFVGLCLRALGVSVSVPPPGAFHMSRVPYERCRFQRLV